MELYIVLVLIVCVILCVAVSARSQELGCLLSLRQTNGRCISIRSLNGSARSYKKYYNFIAFVFLFFLWFLTAFRSANIGNDTQNYLYYFEKICETGIKSEYRFEYGFQLLCYIVGFFAKNAYVFIAVCATICYVGIGVYVFKYSKNVLVSVVLVFIFCFSSFVNTLRQDIASVICLYAYQAIKDKKNLKAFFLILVGVTFHKTAAVCLLLLLYKWINVGFKFNVILAALISILSLFGVLDTLLSLLGPYGNYFQGQYAGTGRLAVTYSIVQSLFFFLFIGKANKKSLGDKKVIMVNCVALLLCNALGFTVNLFTRAAQYFLFPIITEFPNACYDGKVKSKNLWQLCVCILLIGYFLVVLVFRPEWNNLYPYNFFWR